MLTKQLGYGERDLKSTALTIAAYALAGYDNSELSECDSKDEVPSVGWAEVVMEEVSLIYNAGVQVATMSICARGSMFQAELAIDRATYKANDITPIWVKV